MKDNIFVKASVRNGELHFPIKATGTKFRKFLNQLPDDSKLEIFIGVSGDKGSNPQLARLHAMIREIAQQIGYTFEEAKIQVKRSAGLCFVKDHYNVDRKEKSRWGWQRGLAGGLAGGVAEVLSHTRTIGQPFHTI